MPTDHATTPELAHDTRETLGRLIRRLRAEPGPPVGPHAVLGRLDRQGPASISDLATAERMRPQSMAQIVNDLEEAGSVSRGVDSEDRRRVMIELTPAGLATLEETRARREDWLAQTLDAELSARERDLLRKALVLLDRVAAT
jgi:DNA-binding MarR family transcriptional regulator